MWLEEAINGGHTLVTMPKLNYILFLEPNLAEFREDSIAAVAPGEIQGCSAVVPYKEAFVVGAVRALLCICDVGRAGALEEIDAWVNALHKKYAPRGINVLLRKCEGDYASQWHALNKISGRRVDAAAGAAGGK